MLSDLVRQILKQLPEHIALILAAQTNLSLIKVVSFTDNLMHFNSINARLSPKIWKLAICKLSWIKQPKE